MWQVHALCCTWKHAELTLPAVKQQLHADLPMLTWHGSDGTQACDDAGVKIPKFEQLHTGAENSKISLTGLGSGGQQIQTCRKAFMNSIELLVQLASLQTAFLTLDEAIKTTNRRVNALDNVVCPKLENTISYIKVFLQVLQTQAAAVL